MLRAVRRSLSDFAVALGLLALCLVWLGRSLFGGQALLPVELLQQMRPWLEKPPLWWDPILWDAVGYFAPSRKLLHESVTAGHLPLWNPYELCGTPFLANIQSAVLYPLGFAFWLWPPEVAFGVNALLHLFLAGFFAYFMA